MRRKKAWPMMLHIMSFMLLAWAFLMFLTPFPALSHETQKTENKKFGSAKLANGQVITSYDLNKIIKSHALWFKTDGKDEKRADLHEAELVLVDLKNVNLSRADMSRARLFICDMSDAAPYKADLRGAALISSNLANANLHGADLTGALLLLTDLHGTNFTTADMSQVTFDPLAGTVPDASKIGGIKGLSSEPLAKLSLELIF